MKKKNEFMLGFLGLLLLAAYFMLLGRSQLISQLQPLIPRQKALELAEAKFRSSELREYDLRRSVHLSVDNDLLKYAQQNRDSVEAAELPILGWAVSWSGKMSAADGKKHKVKYRVELDKSGRLRGVEFEHPGLDSLPSLDQAEALNIALNDLAARNIDTAAVTLTQNEFFKDKSSKFVFTFTAPAAASAELNTQYKITITGNRVTAFSTNLVLKNEAPGDAGIKKIANIAVIVLTAAFWVIVLIYLFVIFLKRLRADALDFRNARWLGLLTFVVIFYNVAYSSWPDWPGVLLAAPVAGLFSAAGVLLGYAVVEALYRTLWPEKLALIDLTFRGHFRVREMGQAIMQAFWITGLSLFALGLLIFLSGYQHLLYTELKSENLNILTGANVLPTLLAGNVSLAVFLGLFVLAFPATQLRPKIRSNRLLIGLLALFVALATVNSALLQPNYLALFLILPIAVLWGRLAIKADLFTVLLAALMTLVLLDFSMQVLIPAGFLDLQCIIFLLALLLLFVTGAHLTRIATRVGSFGEYVPEYISRIAERERLLKELEIARRVQQQFLPQQTPEIAQLDIAALCEPAMQVGGDYYDFVVDAEGNLGVVIGDVSGKGVSAAFYMTMAKGIIKTLARKKVSPKQILSEVNAVFYENAPRGVFISVIYAYFDFQDRSLTFARAGHNPLIVHKTHRGEPDMYSPKGIAVGLADEQQFARNLEEITVPIEAGDVFVFYTDGVSESMNSREEEYGEERLQKVVSDNANLPAGRLLQTITADVQHFSGDATQHDDLTIVLVKVRG